MFPFNKEDIDLKNLDSNKVLDLISHYLGIAKDWVIATTIKISKFFSHLPLWVQIVISLIIITIFVLLARYVIINREQIPSLN